jgi:hypothetical protein
MDLEEEWRDMNPGRMAEMGACGERVLDVGGVGGRGEVTGSFVVMLLAGSGTAAGAGAGAGTTLSIVVDAEGVGARGLLADSMIGTWSSSSFVAASGIGPVSAAIS